MKEFRVYSRRIAVELKKRGFKIIRTDINELQPLFKVWVFEATDNFRIAFDEILNSK